MSLVMSMYLRVQRFVFAAIKAVSDLVSDIDENKSLTDIVYSASVYFFSRHCMVKHLVKA